MKMRYGEDNHEIYQLFKEVRISEFVRLQKLRWAGHVVG